jgi:hypothetical protein
MTDELEDSDRSRIRQLIQETIQSPTIGEVQEVFARSDAVANSTDKPPSNHELTVTVPPGATASQTFERIPVLTATSGVVATPRKGDLVLLLFPARGSPFCIGNIYGSDADDRAPKGDVDVIRLTRGDLYVELLPDGTKARIANKTDDTTAPDAEITLTADGTIDINTDGDINISGGQVTIDEGDSAGATSVLTENAQFEFQQRIDTGTGGGGTNTKLTSTVANGETTETDIE